MKKFKSIVKHVTQCITGESDEPDEAFTLRGWAVLLASSFAGASTIGLCLYLLNPSEVGWGIRSSIGIAVAGFFLLLAEVEAWKEASRKRSEKVMNEANSR